MVHLPCWRHTAEDFKMTDWYQVGSTDSCCWCPILRLPGQVIFYISVEGSLFWVDRNGTNVVLSSTSTSSLTRHIVHWNTFLLSVWGKPSYFNYCSQLHPVWPLSSDLFHQQGVSVCRTDTYQNFFREYLPTSSEIHRPACLSATKPKSKSHFPHYDVMWKWAEASRPVTTAAT